jgi:hypothetical protein
MDGWMDRQRGVITDEGRMAGGERAKTKRYGRVRMDVCTNGLLATFSSFLVFAMLLVYATASFSNKFDSFVSLPFLPSHLFLELEIEKYLV